jgi:hypothetical protein
MMMGMKHDEIGFNLVWLIMLLCWLLELCELIIKWKENNFLTVYEICKSDYAI